MASVVSSKSLIFPFNRYSSFHLKTANYYFQTLVHVDKASFFKPFQNAGFQTKPFLQKYCFSFSPLSKNNSVHSLSLAHFGRQALVSSEQSYYHTEDKVLLPFMLGLMGASILTLKSVQANDGLDEEKITERIKQAIDKEDRIQEMFGMKNLGDCYFKKNNPKALIQSAGLYNYVHRIAVELEDKQRQEEALQKLCFAERRLLSLFSSSSKINQKQFSENRKKLKNFREKIDQKILSLKNSRTPKEVALLHEYIAQEVKQIVSDLIEQSIEMLGPPPCAFSAIGFGSLAREETTPYSDLEFGFLIEKDTPRNKEYFRRLTYLIHLRVVNLGETILPCLNIPSLKGVFDGTTPRGFSFDGEGVQGKGCKTPFGNRKTFSLIQTPQNMAKYQGKERKFEQKSHFPHQLLDFGYIGRETWWFEKEPHLPMELLNFCHLYGNEKLSEDYKDEINKKLSLPYDNTFTVRDYLVRNHLVKEDFDFFNPRLGDLEKEGQLFRAKNDFYRFPHLAIDRLAWIYLIEETSTFKRIEGLCEKKVLTKEATEKLKWLMSETMWTRLEVYSYYKRQWDIMNPLLKPFGFEDPELIREQFTIDKKGLERIEKIYQVVIPFYEIMRRFLLYGDEENLKKSSLWDESAFILGEIASRLLQHDKAESYFLEAKKKNPNDSRTLNNLGILFCRKGNLDEALHFYNEALKINIKTFGKRSPHVAVNHNNLGLIHRDKGNLGEAIKQIEKALNIGIKCFGKKTHILAMFLSNLGLVYQDKGERDKATKCMEEALDIEYEIFSKNDFRIARHYNNLGSIYREKGDLDLAIKHINKALSIHKESFGENSPNVARDHSYLATIYQSKGDLDLAIKSVKSSLRIYSKFFGTKNFQTATCYEVLGTIYLDKGNLDKAIYMINKALNINLHLFGENNEKVAKDYNVLGTIYLDKGNLDKAIYMINKALNINLHLFGENSIAVGSNYNALGMVYKAKKEFEKAANYINKSLTILLGLFDEENPEILTLYNNLALIYNAISNFEKAIKYMSKALEIGIKIFGKNNPNVAGFYNSLGQIHYYAGNLDLAIDYKQESLKIYENLLGKTHFLTIKVRNDLGIIIRIREQ